MFNGVKNLFLDVLFPTLCMQCKKDGLILCSNCMDSLPSFAPQCISCGIVVPGSERAPPGRTCLSCRKKTIIYAYISPLQYRNELVRTLIHDYKYRRISSLHARCVELLIRHIAYYKIIIPSDAIAVAIPLHARRQRVRGFNQAELLAKGFAERMGISFHTALVRVRPTVSQMSLPRSLRLTNMSDAFSLSESADIKGKTILLFDDVKTTGATLEEAARILKKGGARRVWAMTLAH